MPIVGTDISWRYSGGAANTSAAACLGGAISTAGGGVIDNAVKNDLFDDVSSAEASAGDIEYRAFYLRNDHATITLEDARVYISVATSSANDEMDIALADEAVTTTIETIANEQTAPVGPVFSRPSTYAAGLVLNGVTGLVPAAYKGIWIRRTVDAAAGPGSVTCTLKWEGQTA